MSKKTSGELWRYSNVVELSLMAEDSHNQILASLQ